MPVIPDTFLLWRYTHEKRLLVLVSLDGSRVHLQSHTTRPTLSGFKQPVYEGWKERIAHPIPHLDTSMWYEGMVYEFNGARIPCMNLRKACQLLPDDFTLLADRPQYWIFSSGLTEADVHRAAVVSWFTPGDCPITMRPLDAETACLTPCRHLFQRDALFTWLQQRSHCPVCRHPVQASEVHV